MFVDASREFEQGKKQNKLRANDIEEIVNAVRDGRAVERYAHPAKLAEVRENEFNLNISRYVNSSENDQLIDLEAVQSEIDALERDLANTRSEIARELAALGF